MICLCSSLLNVGLSLQQLLFIFVLLAITGP